MKKIFYLFSVIALLSLLSCYPIDNWEQPSCAITGTVYDSYTGKPLLASQNEWVFRAWERSWSEIEGGAPSGGYNTLRIKQDGTYKNTKMFPGTFDILPYDGPFWVSDTIKGVELKSKKTTELDFTVTPYLVIDGFTYQHATMPEDRGGGPGLYIKFKVKAPMLTNGDRTLGQLREVRVFLSLTPYCGYGSNSYISIPDYNDNNKGRIDVNQNWSNILNGTYKYAQLTYMGGLSANDNKADPDLHLSPEFDLLVPVKKGYVYNVRVGANTTVSSNRYNYSPIQNIVIPK